MKSPSKPKSSATDDLSAVIQDFALGFSHTRSITYPYEVAKVGDFTILRDAPRTSGDVRNQELITTSTDVDSLIAQIKELRPTRFFLCVMLGLEGDAPGLKALVKAQGFRFLRYEPAFVRPPGGPPEPRTPYRMARITKQEEADAIHQLARRQIRDEEIGNDEVKLRMFAAWDGDRPIAWVKSIRTSPGRSWVSNLYVDPEYRRRGIATDLMNLMLTDDRKRGIQTSVLLASYDGAKLYGSLGYQQVGTLQMFAPIKSIWASYFG